MGQIVAYAQNEEGNFIIEVKPTKRTHSRIRTTQVAGTNWDEPLNGLYAKDPEGNDVPLLANISIRYSNSYDHDLLEDLKPALQVVNGFTVSSVEAEPKKATIIPFRQ